MEYFNFWNLDDYCKKLKLNYNSEYLRWLKDIVNTKVSMFSYDNLPEGLTSEIIETALLFNNHLCFYKSKELDELILCRYIPNGKFDYYWKPTKVNLLALNGQPIAYDVSYEDIILVRDNRMDIIPFLTLTNYLSKIMEMEQTLTINVQLLRLPTVFSCEKSQVPVFKQIFKDIQDFKPFVIGDKSIGDSIDPIKFDLPCSVGELYDLIEKYRNLALGSIGIYASDSKRERLITAEIQATNDFVDFVYQGMLNERKLFVDTLNKLGYNVRVEETYVIAKHNDAKLEIDKTKQIEEVTAKAQNLIEDKGGNEDGRNDI